MKKLIRFASVVAFAATFVYACEKEQESKDTVFEGVEINITVDGSISPESKTAVVDGAIPSVKWLSTDQLTVYEIVDGAVNATTTTTSTTLSGSDYVASFKATIPGEDPSGSSYKYAAVYPASAVSAGAGTPPSFYRLTMPDAQHLNGNNFSADSDIMISEVLDHGDSRVTSSESISFQFKRVGTAVKLTLKGITADEKIQRVTLTAPHYIAGRVKYVRETSSLVSDSWHYSGQGQNTINLTIDDLTATGTDVIWFRVLAAEKWADGENFSIEVETDKANYYRNGIDGSHAVITLGKDINFVDGGLTAFGVNLASYRVAKPEPVNYTLVEDNANIVDGADYLVVYTAGSKAMGTYGSSLYNPTDVTITSKVIGITSEVVTVVTLEDAGSGKFYLRVGDNDYLYWSSGNTVTHGSKGPGDEYKWTVTKDNITNVGTTSRKLQYNTSSPRFACYTGTQQDVNVYVNLASKFPLGISFDDASYEFVVNSMEYDAFTGQVVTKSGGVSDDRAVTYSVDSDEDDIVTSINASTGAVVLSGNTGTATIKATVGAKDGVYKAGSVTYTITVTPEPIVFVKATTITSGSKYLIVAEYGGNYYMAKPIVDGTKTYGYPAVESVSPLGDGSIQLYNYDDAYTITTSGLGYSIKQSDNRYWYADGSYTTITIGATPTSVWTADKQDNDTFKLASDSYWIQYSDNFNSFGRYTSTQTNSALPYLYIEDDGSPRASGTPIAFSAPTADAESSTLSTVHLTGVSYSLVSKPAWIDEVEFAGNTMTVTSLDNKTLDARNGVIVVNASGSEGNVDFEVAVSQSASVFSASSTADVNFAWDDYTNAEIKRITITSTYVLTDANAAISGTNAAKFEAAITRNGSTDEYYLDVNLVEDNESENDYTATVTVSRDGLEISIDLKQAHKGNVVLTNGAHYDYTISSKIFSANGSTTLSGMSWTLSTDTQYFAYDTGVGLHLGSSSKAISYANFTLDYDTYCNSETAKLVKTVKVTIKSNGSSPKVEVLVGGTSVEEKTINNTMTEYTYTVDGSLYGDVEINCSLASSAGKNFIIQKVEIN